MAAPGFSYSSASPGPSPDRNGPSSWVTPPRTAPSSVGGSRTAPRSARRASHQARTTAAHSNRLKVALAAIGVLMLHVISANIIIPMVTHRIAGAVDPEPGNGLGFLATSSSLSSAGASIDDDASGGSIIRLLTETAAAFNGGDGILSAEQAALLEEFGEKATRGRDVWIRRDGLTNPLSLPPNGTDASAAGRADNIARYKARTLNNLHRDKCNNETVLPYVGVTGREWVTASRTWTRQFGSRVSKYRWCRGGAESEVPDLKQVLMLRSEKPRPARSVTIVTQLSLERTSMLEQQCAHWPHPISAVVYIPLVRGKIFSAEDEEWMLAPLEKGIDDMLAFYERMTSLQCILDMEVVVEERCTNDLAILYPANAVRNRALLTASSDVVLLLDVDFVADLSLVRSLEDDAQNAELTAALQQGKALVLPAFEAWDQGDWGRKVALDAVKQGKQYIAQKFMYNVVMGFHMSHYPQGHEKTDFWRWINSTEAYEVEYQLGFEPYILMARKYVPYYDERFRGYYWNKVQHLMHISMQNRFTWVVHPQSFVVHVPHRKPSTKWRTKRSGQKERNHVMFLEALDDMKKERFVPVTAFPHLCLPPEMQEAAAQVVGNAEQKEALLAMAKAVAPLEEEVWEAQLAEGGNWAEDEAIVSTDVAVAAKVESSTVVAETKVVESKPIVEPRGELPRAERPVNQAAAAEKAKAKRAKEEFAAAELQKDLEQLRDAEKHAAENRATPADAKAAAEMAAAKEEAAAAKEIMESLETAHLDEQGDELAELKAAMAAGTVNQQRRGAKPSKKAKGDIAVTEDILDAAAIADIAIAELDAAGNGGDGGSEAADADDAVQGAENEEDAPVVLEKQPPVVVDKKATPSVAAAKTASKKSSGAAGALLDDDWALPVVSTTTKTTAAKQAVKPMKKAVVETV